MRSFEEIIDIIRPFGLWQILVVSETFLIQFLLSLPKYQQNYFLAGKMDYECVRFANVSSTFSTTNSSDPAITGDDEEESFDDHCRTTSDDGSIPCVEWRYSSPYYISTIVSEWNLVCDRAYLVPTYKSMYLVGYFFGVPVFGLLSDWFGRFTVIALTAPLQVVTFAVTAISQTFWLAALMRALQGFVHAGTWKAIFVMNIELTKPSLRNWICVMLALCFPLSGCLVSVLGMLEGHWRTAHIYTLLPSMLAIPIVFFLHESPRWLIMSEKYDRAEKIIRRAAHLNKSTDRLNAACGGSNKLNLEQVRLAHVVEDDDMVHHADVRKDSTVTTATEVELSAVPQTATTIVQTINSVTILPQGNVIYEGCTPNSTSVPTQKRASSSWREHVPNVMSLFRSSEMRLRTGVLMVQWFVTGMVFYGTSFYSTGQMSGNPYITLLLSCAMRIANAPALALAMQWLGKKKLLAFLYVFSTISLAAMAVGAEWQMSGIVMTILATIAVCFIDGAFETIYAFTGELYPTTLRQSGMGACSMAARVGAVISPFIADLVAVYWQPFPAIIFGIACILATSILFFLPEMNLKALPETVHDAEQMRNMNLKEQKSVDNGGIDNNIRRDDDEDFSPQNLRSHQHMMVVLDRNNNSFATAQAHGGVNTNPAVHGYHHVHHRTAANGHTKCASQTHCYQQEVSIDDEQDEQENDDKPARTAAAS